MYRTKSSARAPRNYQKTLLARKSELASSLKLKRGHLADLGRTALDDSASAFHDQFVALGVGRLDFIQFELIEAALERIDSKDYGLCADCGNSISKVRLDAIPWAARCVTCQESFGSQSGSDE